MNTLAESYRCQSQLEMKSGKDVLLRCYTTLHKVNQSSRLT